MKQYKIVVVSTNNPSNGEADINKHAREGWEILNMATMDQRGWIVYTMVKHTFDKK